MKTPARRLFVVIYITAVARNLILNLVKELRPALAVKELFFCLSVCLIVINEGGGENMQQRNHASHPVVLSRR